MPWNFRRFRSEQSIGEEDKGSPPIIQCGGYGSYISDEEEGDLVCIAVGNDSATDSMDGENRIEPRQVDDERAFTGFATGVIVWTRTHLRRLEWQSRCRGPRSWWTR